MSKTFNDYLLKISKGKELEVAKALNFNTAQTAAEAQSALSRYVLPVTAKEAIALEAITGESAKTILQVQNEHQLAAAGYKEPKQAAAPKAEKTQRDPQPARSPMYGDDKPKSGRVISCKI